MLYYVTLHVVLRHTARSMIRHTARCMTSHCMLYYVIGHKLIELYYQMGRQTLYTIFSAEVRMRIMNLSFQSCKNTRSSKNRAGFRMSRLKSVKDVKAKDQTESVDWNSWVLTRWIVICVTVVTDCSTNLKPSRNDIRNARIWNGKLTKLRWGVELRRCDEINPIIVKFLPFI